MTTSTRCESAWTNSGPVTACPGLRRPRPAHGEGFLAAYDDWIDDNDPEVIRQRRIGQLDFLDRLRKHFSQVAAILVEADDIHAASAAIAPLLGVDEVEVEIRLNNISLFALTRSASAARAEMLRELREQP